jgi:hypothetical protein
MKSKIFTLLMFVGITAFSQGNVVFFTEFGELFYVSMNGVKVNATPMANVKVEGVKAPGAMVLITFVDPSLGVLHKNVMATDGMENTYKVKRNKKGEWKILPFTSVAMDGAAVTSNTINTSGDPVLIQQKVADPVVDQTVQTTTAVQGTTGVGTTSTTINTTGTNTNVQTSANPTSSGLSLNVNMNGGQSNQQVVTNTNVQPVNTSTTTTTTTTQTSSVKPNNTGVSFNVNINGGSLNTALNNLSNTITSTVTTSTSDPVATDNTAILVDNSQQQTTQNATPVTDASLIQTSTVSTSSGSGCMMAMSDIDFSDAKSSISSKSFEDSKMKVAKQITENNCLSVSQIKEVMGLFSFEQSKLDFAKYAYGHTSEKNNYYKINDVFTYESSIDELQTYIKANK